MRGRAGFTHEAMDDAARRPTGDHRRDLGAYAGVEQRRAIGRVGCGFRADYEVGAELCADCPKCRDRTNAVAVPYSAWGNYRPGSLSGKKTLQCPSKKEEP